MVKRTSHFRGMIEVESTSESVPGILSKHGIIDSGSCLEKEANSSF